jgi:hypothetical protein
MATGRSAGEKDVVGYSPVDDGIPPPPGASADRSSACAFTDSTRNRRSNGLVSR